MSGTRIAWLAAIVILAALPRAVAEEPEPFRGDEIGGRDFDYSDDAFLQRFSYRLKPEYVREWENAGREGYRGTAGSISTSEFFVFSELRKWVELEKPLFFGFHHVQKEDFDSRYSRNLVGLAMRSREGFEVAAQGEIFAEKGLIDVHLSGSYHSPKGHEGRVVLVIVDAPRGKSEEFEYEGEAPYTIFCDGRLRFGEDRMLYGWVNVNTRLRREEVDQGFEYTYWQNSAGARGDWRFDERWLVSAEGGILATQRSQEVSTATPDQEQRFERRSWFAESEIEYAWSENVASWAGVRHFRFSEEDERPLTLVGTTDTIRREWIFHTGVNWRMSERFTFWPGVYVDYIDNRTTFPYGPGAGDDDVGTPSKLALPIDVRFKRGVLTASVSFELEEAAFGGGGVQLLIPF